MHTASQQIGDGSVAFAPCPFCGEADNIDFCDPDNGHVLFVECHQCGALGPSYEHAIINEALRQARRLWNREGADFLLIASDNGPAAQAKTRPRQSRRMSLVESLTNVTVGFGLAVATQMLIFPWFGYEARLRDHLEIALYFTVVSIARSFALRRVFEALR